MVFGLNAYIPYVKNLHTSTCLGKEKFANCTLEHWCRSKISQGNLSLTSLSWVILVVYAFPLHCAVILLKLQNCMMGFTDPFRNQVFHISCLDDHCRIFGSVLSSLVLFLSEIQIQRNRVLSLGVKVHHNWFMSYRLRVALSTLLSNGKA